MSLTLFSPAHVQADDQVTTVDDLWSAFASSRSREDRDRLVLHYTGLVTYVASRMRAPLPSSVDYTDLIQSGVIGLMEAVDRFEPERGWKFETYAVTRIRGAILDSLRAQDWVPRSVRKRVRDLEAASETCRSRLGRVPTEEELAEELGISAGQVDDTRAFTSRMRVVELDSVSSGSDGQGLSLAETLADPFAEQPGDALVAQADREALRVALSALDPRDRAVIVHSYMDGLTLAQIGRLLGVTESRVCQVRAKALRELGAHLSVQLAD